MAERRMFSKTIIDSDAFLEMPQSTQLLYFHFSMRADDDGFINQPKAIMKICGSKDDDIKLLIIKKFIIPFESGILVIKHWKIHNFIAKDRYKETKYKEEKSFLSLDENNSYSLNKEVLSTNCRQVVNDLSTQVRLGKDRLGKDRIESTNTARTKKTYGIYNHVRLTEDEFFKLKQDYPNYEQLIAHLDEYVEMKGTKYKSHYLAIKKWVVDAVKEREQKGKVQIAKNKANNFSPNNPINHSELEKKLMQNWSGKND